MSETPLFGPMADDDRYTRHLAAVRKEVAGAKFGAVVMMHTMRTIEPPFEGVYPHPGPDKVAGYKNPPPPGGSQ